MYLQHILLVRKHIRIVSGRRQNLHRKVHPARSIHICIHHGRSINEENTLCLSIRICSHHCSKNIQHHIQQVCKDICILGCSSRNCLGNSVGSIRKRRWFRSKLHYLRMLGGHRRTCKVLSQNNYLRHRHNLLPGTRMSMKQCSRIFHLRTRHPHLLAPHTGIRKLLCQSRIHQCIL